jgi:hypothetical protein
MLWKVINMLFNQPQYQPVSSDDKRRKMPEEPGFVDCLRDAFIKPARDLALLKHRSGNKFYTRIFNRLENKDFPIVTTAITWALNPGEIQIIKDRYEGVDLRP